MHRGPVTPGRVLVVSPRDPARLEAVTAAVVPSGAAITVVHPGEPLADPRPFDGVLLDGDQRHLSDTDVARLHAWVQQGGTVLAIGAAETAPGAPIEALLGARTTEPLPFGEFFCKPAVDATDVVERLPREFAVRDSFAPLVSLNGGATDLLRVSVRFTDRTAVLAHEIGAGRVIVSAVGRTEAALASPELRTVFRRALRPPAPPAGPVRVAIVGYGPLGGMGYRHGIAIAATPGLALVAACDSNPARLQAASTDFPGLRTYASADAVASDPGIDLVIIATPPVTHASLALQMLEAGKHVACEKPLCLTVAEADRLIATARANGLELTVHQNRRWDGDFRAIQETVDRGSLGEVFNVETFVGGFDHPCREWHSEVTISGGTEYDWGSHCVDWILQLMPGLPSAVYATGHKRVWHDVSNYDQIRIRMLWDDGREAEFLHSDVAAIRRPKFYVQGTRGTLAGWYRPLVQERIDPGLGYVRHEFHHAEAPAELTLMRYDAGFGGLVEERLRPAPVEPHAFHRNLADHLLRNDVELAVPAESARQVIAVLQAAHLSAEQGGKSVRLPV